MIDLEHAEPVGSFAACADCQNDTDTEELSANGGVCDFCEQARRDRQLHAGQE